MAKRLNLLGRTFGRLLVIEEDSERSKWGGIRWKCLCSCGKIIIIAGANLNSGNSKSCGCVSDELISIRNKENKKYIGANKRILNCWKHMIGRCENKNNNSYKNYGGRGIVVCKEWKIFENFQTWAINNEYEETLTLDRINVNGNYEPKNCRWATMKEQGNNRREHHLIEINGIIKNITQWAEDTGLHYKTILLREKMGWKGEDLISEKYILRGKK